MTLVTAGRVGRAHGWDGSFYVEGATHELPEGIAVTVEGHQTTVERRAGTPQRPLIRLAGVTALDGLHGRPLLVEEVLGEGEWLAADLEGCEVVGMGRVARVVDLPSCAVLELEDGRLVPFISDAVLSFDATTRRIEVDGNFLGEP